jgi:hypothetical protein
MFKCANAIDHIVVAVPDIEAARAELTEAGFQVTPRAVHERFGTQNYLIVFDDAYLELLGVTGGDAIDRTSQEVLTPVLGDGGGVAMLALTADNMDATREQLEALGISAQAPVAWSRLANTPDGPRSARFETMFLNSPLLPGFFTFYCRQETPEYVRHPHWREHPNGARRLLGLTRTSDLDHGAALISAKMLGGAINADGSVEIAVGIHSLIYRAEESGFAQCEIFLGTQGAARSGETSRLNTVHGVSITLL